MKHLMIDLETMDNKPTAAITAIGAVLFNPETGEMGETFYRRISLTSSVDYDCTMGADTVLWWLRQSIEAKTRLLMMRIVRWIPPYLTFSILSVNSLMHIIYRSGVMDRHSTTLFFVMLQIRSAC